MKLPFHSYSFRARFLPAVLVLAPAIAAVAAWVPIESTSWTILGSAGVLVATAILLSHFARDLGQRKQERLFSLWDGPPTTRFLRHRDQSLNAKTRQRYHEKLATLIPGIRIPSARSERERPEAADAVYASCADWLRERTRDRSKYGLVFEENVGFGFRRNLWAMKPAGVALAALGLVASVTRLGADILASSKPSVETGIALMLSAAIGTWWVARIRPAWVSQAASSYAKSILATCEGLGDEEATV